MFCQCQRQRARPSKILKTVSMDNMNNSGDALRSTKDNTATCRTEIPKRWAITQFWVKSPSVGGQKLNHECYDKTALTPTAPTDLTLAPLGVKFATFWFFPDNAKT